MTVTTMRVFVARMALVAIAAATMVQAQAATFTLVDSEGFEAPLNTTTFMGTGQLEGQLARTIDGASSDPWQAAGAPTSTAIVQNSVAAPGGTQSVRVDRAAGASDRWAVPLDVVAPVAPYVCISWDMMVPTQTLAVGAQGPVFGVEAYDAIGPFEQLSLFGVDIASRELVYLQSTGYVNTGVTINYDEWNNFLVTLDYTNDTYEFLLNGVHLATVPFVDGSGTTNELTDVDIAALPGGGDAASMAATGFAYFDNFIVFETDVLHSIPEPSTFILVGLGLAAIAIRKRVA